MSERLSKLREALQAAKVTAVAAVPGANLRYLTGLGLHMNERLTVAFLTHDGRIAIVLPRLEQPRAAAQARLPIQFYPWNDADGPYDALRRCLLDLELEGRIGVEYTAMRVLELRGIEQSAPLPIEIVDGAGIFSALRMRKDAEERELMAEAVRIIEESLQATISQIHAGMTERQVAAIWEREIAARGSSSSFPANVASGPNAANPHHSNSDRQFQQGDLVILDGGAWYQGYTSDITRTIAIGEPSPEARRIYDLVLAANTAGREAAVRPGATGASIDHAAREVITVGGYGPQFLHRTGHGIGLEVHEPPYIVAGSDAPLPIGATFTIEPGIYVEGFCGVRIEDDIIITDGGAESLTSFNRDLIIVS